MMYIIRRVRSTRPISACRTRNLFIITAYKTVSGVNGPLVILDDVKVIYIYIYIYIFYVDILMFTLSKTESGTIMVFIPMSYDIVM